MRSFYHNDQLYFVASSKDATPTGKVVMTMGKYEMDPAKARDVRVLEPPTPSDREKNWIYVPSKYVDHIPTC